MNTHTEQPYVRTDAEKSHQTDYETKENARHGRAGITVTIKYAIEESKPKEWTPVTRKSVWHLRRTITHSIDLPDSVTVMGPYFRRYEALQAKFENVRRDQQAAIILGIHTS